MKKTLFTWGHFLHISFLFSYYCNKKLSTYLEYIEVENVLCTPNHPQSQGAFEVFKKKR